VTNKGFIVLGEQLGTMEQLEDLTVDLRKLHPDLYFLKEYFSGNDVSDECLLSLGQHLSKLPNISKLTLNFS